MTIITNSRATEDIGIDVIRYQVIGQMNVEMITITEGVEMVKMVEIITITKNTKIMKVVEDTVMIQEEKEEEQDPEVITSETKQRKKINKFHY